MCGVVRRVRLFVHTHHIPINRQNQSTHHPPTNPKQGAKVPVAEMRAVLLAPVLKFAAEHPGYGEYLARQLINDDWPSARGKVRMGVGWFFETCIRTCLRVVRLTDSDQTHTPPTPVNTQQTVAPGGDAPRHGEEARVGLRQLPALGRQQVVKCGLRGGGVEDGVWGVRETVIGMGGGGMGALCLVFEGWEFGMDVVWKCSVEYWTGRKLTTQVNVITLGM